ncbi:MAG: glycosyltransferase family 4 protein [Chloroflexi bacterium]|nr:glycosyltransferase family 4 protein [Chloroflexota bacterium]
MRILHVVHQYPPDDVGGTELYTQTLADWQAAQGHHTAVFTPSPQPPTDPALNQAHENGVQVYRLKLGPQSRTRVFWRTFGQSQVMAGFTAVLDQEQPDLIHIQHLMGLPAGLVDVIICAGIPYVVTLHDYWYLCANAQLLTNYDQTICEGPDWWLNCARCALARAGHPQAVAAVPALAPLLALRQQKLQRVLKQARAIITPSQFAARLHEGNGRSPQKIHVVPHGIVLPPQLPGRPNTPDTFRIAYIGGLSWQKGVHVALEAFARLPAPAEFWLAGDLEADPAYSAELQALATPGVSFLGKLDREAIWDLLAGVDVVVVPSLWYESFVFVISEAFAMGVPVIASDLGVLADRVRHDVDGLLIPAGDVNAWQQALARLQQDSVLRERLRQGIRPVRSFSDHAAEIQSIYQQIAPALP